MVNIWFQKEQKEVTYSMGGNKTEIAFALVGKSDSKYLKGAKTISWELQHQLMATDVS